MPLTSAHIDWATLVSADPDKHNVYSQNIEVCGYITSQRAGRQVNFLQLVDPALKLAIQVVATTPASEPNDVTIAATSGQAEIAEAEESVSFMDAIKNIKAHTPVIVKGKAKKRHVPPKSIAPKNTLETQADKNQSKEAAKPKASPKQPPNTVKAFDPFVGDVNLISHIEIQEVVSIRPLNQFPRDLIATTETVFPPEQRHLQFRTDQGLRHRLQRRTQVANLCRQHLTSVSFQEVETPLLFKSTPEGAREFIVPTRKAGFAYALPQSPQQYKQVLMASGLSRYFQFAKCFRDEDLRADRQPEFTQLDLEMSFATRVEVMSHVQRMLKHVWQNLGLSYSFVRRPLAYSQAMSTYGSDKPDIRFDSHIRRVTDWFAPPVVARLSSLDNPDVQMMKIDMQGTSPDKSSSFVRSFMDSPTSSAYINNPAGMPGIAIYDPSKPLRGLASFEHEGAAKIEEAFKPELGDILIAQTRRRGRYSGGSTVLGNIRRDIHAAAIKEGLVKVQDRLAALWVVDFPLFSPLEEAEPGQGGMAGFCSTHHPFTAPKQGQDLSKLITSPLSVIGDHYDLVVNGVEVGGGSRRIHTADMQELVFRDVLQMKQERIEHFRHLLTALDSGCPPHAGFALGFDRLIALMTGRHSVRDVIAFPKSADGEDKFVGSPSPLTHEQLATYHLKRLETVSRDLKSAETNGEASSMPISITA
ncbi:hypothetical protein LTR84_009437 [Exophiala bonariae]|uniref:Aminoacyl-transfer RNA synthetases class-II family profile domain-containing protein n=1 Tax=Exophiala bonariae TaxID=1690606 RepID=A0AAV9MUP5_9EURO|nr:hypothetical protein LTR84_009437 [Exophiala bonariae]